MHDLLVSFPELPLLVAVLVVAVFWSAARQVIASVVLVVVLVLVGGIVIHSIPIFGLPASLCYGTVG